MVKRQKGKLCEAMQREQVKLKLLTKSEVLVVLLRLRTCAVGLLQSKAGSTTAEQRLMFQTPPSAKYAKWTGVAHSG